MDVIFVNMPLAWIERPALNLSLLAAQLKAAGINTDVIYANIQFADLVGIHANKHFYQMSSELIFGDWLFKPSLFDIDETDTGYIDLLALELKGTFYYDFFSDRKIMSELREKATEFTDRLTREIAAKNPCIVGCTSMFDQHVASLSLLKKIKSLNPGIVTMMGGANCEGEMGKATHQLFPWVDYVISGYCDDFITPLCAAIIENGPNSTNHLLNSRLYAPVHRQEGYDIPEQVSHKVNLNNLPIPDYSDFFNTLDRFPELKKHVHPTLPVESSRNCSWGKCRFCGLNGKHNQYLTKSWDNIYHEINTLATRYNVRRIEFVDNMVHLNMAMPLLEKLKNDPIPYMIFCEIRSNLSKTDIKNMRDAGFIWVQPGIESLSNEVLDWMKKGTDVVKNIQTLKWCLEYGIQTVWSIMYDLPGENDQWYRAMSKVTKLISHLGAPKGLNKTRIDRFSEYYLNQEKYNLDLVPKEIYSFVYPFNDQTIGRLAYYYESRQEVLFRKDPRLKVLIGRPIDGVKQVGKVLTGWINAFNKGALDILEYEQVGDRLVIRDTRPVAVSDYHELSELESRIYLMCDHAVTIAVIKEKLAAVDEVHIVEALAALVDAKLMLQFNRTYLSLAVKKDHIPLPDNHMFPCGYVDFRADAAAGKCGTGRLSDPIARSGQI